LNTTLVLVVNFYMVSDSSMVSQVRAAVWERAAGLVSVFVVSALAGNEGGPKEREGIR
jgi:hypothetical protein